MGTRLLIPQGSLAAHPTLADPVGEKNPRSQDKDFFFLLRTSQKLLEGTAHTSTCVYTHVQPHIA